jgi:hypothetical protein
MATFLYVRSDDYKGNTPNNISELFNSLGINDGNSNYLYEKIQSVDFTCEPFSKEDINKYVKNSICIYLEDNTGKIIGICCVRFDKEIIFLTFICVPPKSKGNGKMLLGKIKDISNETSYAIELSSMPNVVKYYQNNGFEIKDPEIDQVSKRHNVTTDDFSEYGTIDMSYTPRTTPPKKTVSIQVDEPKRVKFSMRIPVKMRCLHTSKRSLRKKRTIKNKPMSIIHRTRSYLEFQHSIKNSNKRKSDAFYPHVNKTRRLT